MRHHILIKEEDEGLRLYLDAVPLMGKWYVPKDRIFAVYDAEKLARQNTPCEIIMVHSNGYRETVKVIGINDDKE